MGKLTETLKKKTSTSISRSDTTIRSNTKPPKDSLIREQTVRTETEEIENGFLITKSWDGTYWKNKEKDDYTWFNYSKKWYSKEDPMADAPDLMSAFDDE